MVCLLSRGCDFTQANIRALANHGADVLKRTAVKLSLPELGKAYLKVHKVFAFSVRDDFNKSVLNGEVFSSADKCMELGEAIKALVAAMHISQALLQYPAADVRAELGREDTFFWVDRQICGHQNFKKHRRCLPTLLELHEMLIAGEIPEVFLKRVKWAKRHLDTRVSSAKADKPFDADVAKTSSVEDDVSFDDVLTIVRAHLPTQHAAVHGVAAKRRAVRPRPGRSRRARIALLKKIELTGG